MLSIKTTLVLCNDPRDDRAKFEAPILLFASRGANFSRVLGHHSVLYSEIMTLTEDSRLKIWQIQRASQPLKIPENYQ